MGLTLNQPSVIRSRRVKDHAFSHHHLRRGIGFMNRCLHAQCGWRKRRQAGLCARAGHQKERGKPGRWPNETKASYALKADSETEYILLCGIPVTLVTRQSEVTLYQKKRFFPPVPTFGTASELVRYDKLVFLYAYPGPMPHFSPVFRRITRLGLQHGPGSFVNFSI